MRIKLFPVKCSVNKKISQMLTVFLLDLGSLFCDVMIYQRKYVYTPNWDLLSCAAILTFQLSMKSSVSLQERKNSSFLSKYFLLIFIITFFG